MAAGVAGRGNQEQVAVEPHLFLAGDAPLDLLAGSGAAAQFVAVHHARAAEVRRELRVIGDIVTVGEKHQLHAAHAFDALHQRRREARGIHQHVAALTWRTHDEVRPRPEARLRGKAAEVDIADNGFGKSPDARGRAAMQEAVPIEAVGQATNAISARPTSPASRGCAKTLDCPP